MDGSDRGPVSLFHHSDADIRVFLCTLAASILIHLAFVVALIFASEHRPTPPLSDSVIDVTVVSLAETQVAAGPAPVETPPETAVPEAPPELSQAELEALLMQQQGPKPAPVQEPEPIPQTPPEPTPPPDPAQEQVVIDPKEPKEPPPEKPEKKQKTPPAPDKKKEPEKPAPLPVKAPKFNKPAKPQEPVEAPQPDQESIREAIAAIEKKIAQRTEGRYRAAPEPEPAAETPPRTTGGRQTEGSGNGAAGQGTLGIQAKAAITSYAGSVLPDRINRNWAFSEHLASRRFNLEAVLVIKIRSDGEIVDTWFEKKSGDRYFDNSAYNAVVKSNPLPPLPRAYTTYADTYTIGLRFTPSGLN
jgi:colicin import membrane protein